MGLLRDAAHLAIAGIQRRATLSRLQLAESKLHLKLRESAFDVMDSVVSQADEFEGWAIADDEGFWRKSNAGFTLTQMRQTTPSAFRLCVEVPYWPENDKVVDRAVEILSAKKWSADPIEHRCAGGRAGAFWLTPPNNWLPAADKA